MNNYVNNTYRWLHPLLGEIYLAKAAKVDINYKRRDAIKRHTEKAFNYLWRLDRMKSPVKIRIIVEWRKSRTWGMNPYATVAAYDPWESTKANVSGCGYDKESAAVANCLNNNDVILSLLVRNWGVVNGLCGLVRYNGSLPYFSGGVGMSCFIKVFEQMQYTVESVHGEQFDAYVCTLKGAE